MGTVWENRTRGIPVPTLGTRRKWEVCKGKDHLSEDDGYEPEGIDLDSDETNTHGELNGDMHWVYEHEGLEYGPRDEEHKYYQLDYEPKHSGNGNGAFECGEPDYEDAGQVYIQTSNPRMQNIFAPEVIQILPELPMLTVLTQLPYSCVYTTFSWQMHILPRLCWRRTRDTCECIHHHPIYSHRCHSGKGCEQTCLRRVQPLGFLVRHAFIVDSYRTT